MFRQRGTTPQAKLRRRSFSYGYRDHRDLHSFPTRRSSDLAADADPDTDGAKNLLEYLTGTDPLAGNDAWKINVQQSGDTVEISFPQLANRGFQVEWTPGLKIGRAHV